MKPVDIDSSLRQSESFYDEEKLQKTILQLREQLHFESEMNSDLQSENDKLRDSLARVNKFLVRSLKAHSSFLDSLE